MGGGDSSRQASGWVRQPERGAQAWGGGWGQGRREGLAQGGALPQLVGPSRSPSKNHTSTSGSIPAVLFISSDFLLGPVRSVEFSVTVEISDYSIS